MKPFWIDQIFISDYYFNPICEVWRYAEAIVVIVIDGITWEGVNQILREKPKLEHAIFFCFSVTNLT